jgi:hypothetical protein
MTARKMSDAGWESLCDEITQQTREYYRLMNSDDPKDLVQLDPDAVKEYQARAESVLLPLERLEKAAAEFSAAAKEAFWAAYYATYPKHDAYFEEDSLAAMVDAVSDKLESTAVLLQIQDKLLRDRMRGVARGERPYYLGQISEHLFEGAIQEEFGQEFNFWLDTDGGGGDGVGAAVMYRPKAKPVKPGREARFKGKQ